MPRWAYLQEVVKALPLAAQGDPGEVRLALRNGESRETNSYYWRAGKHVRFEKMIRIFLDWWVEKYQYAWLMGA